MSRVKTRWFLLFFFFFQAEDGIRDHAQSRGLGDVYKRQVSTQSTWGSKRIFGKTQKNTSHTESMSIRRVIGVALFCAIFILSGVHKIQKPQDSSAFFNTQYTRFGQWLSSHNITLPTSLQPSVITQQSNTLMLYSGIFEVACAGLVLIGANFFALFLGLFLIGTIAIMHNPLLSSTPEQKSSDTLHALLNTALLAASLIIAAGSQRAPQPKGPTPSGSSGRSSSTNEATNKKRPETRKTKQTVLSQHSHSISLFLELKSLNAMSLLQEHTKKVEFYD
eukprot:TRINITY_DN1130_c0_g1_i1.p1 TRINITY_DN1130_c0_g1~~TRINITY_DN1130_c0_g1_i1.p1  ORF type:complete len:278 (+),score=83.27 TRINITY_DN1130_c0_g1_i1:13-846(+)